MGGGTVHPKVESSVAVHVVQLGLDVQSEPAGAVAISRNGTEHLKTRNSYVNPHCSV